MIQTTLEGAALKWFPVLPIEIKSKWKQFLLNESKLFMNLKTHDYEDMKLTEFIMMTLTPQLRKTAKKESITTIINPRTQYGFRKLVDNLEQAEVPMKL